MAFGEDDALYVAASLRGDRGIFRIERDAAGRGGEATLVVAGSNIVGLCLLTEGRAAVATRDAVYAVELQAG